MLYVQHDTVKSMEKEVKIAFTLLTFSAIV